MRAARARHRRAPARSVREDGHAGAAALRLVYRTHLDRKQGWESGQRMASSMMRNDLNMRLQRTPPSGNRSTRTLCRWENGMRHGLTEHPIRTEGNNNDEEEKGKDRERTR